MVVGVPVPTGILRITSQIVSTTFCEKDKNKINTFREEPWSRTV